MREACIEESVDCAIKRLFLFTIQRIHTECIVKAVGGLTNGMRLILAVNTIFLGRFFEQFRELIKSVPQLALFNKQAVNSSYCHSTIGNKNCYLIFGGDYNEDSLYSTFNFYSKDSSDLYWVFRSERSYELIDSQGCFNVVFGQYCENCFDSRFLYDCKNCNNCCNNCFGCAGLRNKSYCIFNKQYTKEIYQEKIREFDLASYKGLQNALLQWKKLNAEFPRRASVIERSVACTGNNIINSKRCHQCYDVETNIEDARHLWLAFEGPKDLNSVCHISGSSEICHDSCSIVQSSQIFFSEIVWNQSRSIYCSYHSHNSSNLFGCVGVRNKSYCILNRQYTKEEYERLVPKIIDHMNTMPYTDKKGRIYKYGEFFPTELSPFAYNETVAQEYFPLTKEEAIERGYTWEDPETKNYTITIPHNKLPDHIKDVSDVITAEIIGCAHEGKCQEQCTVAFRIIPQELSFYRKMNLPLPRLCSNCRHYQRIKQRNPLKLWHRKCTCAGEKSENGIYLNTGNHPSHQKDQHCPNEFETTYASDRPEIVYCESCYQIEVT